jgi:hypothetical protein
MPTHTTMAPPSEKSARAPCSAPPRGVVASSRGGLDYHRPDFALLVELEMDERAALGFGGGGGCAGANWHQIVNDGRRRDEPVYITPPHIPLRLAVRLKGLEAEHVLTGRQRAYSGKCRAALSRQRRAADQAEKDRRVRELAAAILREVGAHRI